MKVLLINSEPYHVEQKTAIPLGLLSIATYLTQHGYTVRIYDRIVEGGHIRKYLDSFSPDIVGISALGIKSFPDAVKVSKYLKKRNIPVVWGGPLPSLMPEIVLKTGFVDYVVIGEGEITMLALINAVKNNTPLEDVDGLAFVKEGSMIINRQREFADLSQLPVIDWSFVDPGKYFIRNVSCKRSLHVYSSKGCTGRCAFCYNPSFSKCIWRARPPEFFLSEIQYLVDTYGIDGVFFADDLLSPNREYLASFCNRIIESGLPIVWGCDLRVDSCRREELQLMYDAGCRWIFFGIESGSEQRQVKIKKRINLDKAKETINHCKEIGIVTTTSFIIGFPDETVEELKETVDFIKGLNSDVKIAFYYYPFPNSELYNSLVESNRFAVPQSYKEWGKFATLNTLAMNFSMVPDKDLKVICSYFLFTTIFKKYRNNKTESRVYARKAFGQTFEFLKRGKLNSIIMVFLAVKKFLGILYYNIIFPGIRKEYGLYNEKE